MKYHDTTVICSLVIVLLLDCRYPKAARWDRQLSITRVLPLLEP